MSINRLEILESRVEEIRRDAGKRRQDDTIRE